jgi:hypothetical protein
MVRHETDAQVLSMFGLKQMMINKFRPYILFAFLIAGTIVYVALITGVPPVDWDVLTPSPVHSQIQNS